MTQSCEHCNKNCIAKSQRLRESRTGEPWSIASIATSLAGCEDWSQGALSVSAVLAVLFHPVDRDFN